MFGLLGDSGGSSLPSEFNDPFEHKSVERISIYLHKRKSSMFRDNCMHEATIYFQNGNTKGEQTIYENDVPALFLKIEAFIKNMP